jgi:stalled ribosome rescue protein Dom34
MKQNNQKQFAGVWFDNSHAIIIANASEDGEEYAIQEKVKAGRSHGGGSEHSMNNTKHSELLKYFKSVSSLLLHYDEVLIFGPGKSQEQFQNHLKEDPQFKSKQITIDSTGQLTDPQMVARVRDFFKSRRS